ncbi:hypothetical protein GCM10027291_20520 [Telluribacter humicola]
MSKTASTIVKVNATLFIIVVWSNFTRGFVDNTTGVGRAVGQFILFI